MGSQGVIGDRKEEACSKQGKWQKQRPLGEKSLGELTDLGGKWWLSEEGGEQKRGWWEVEMRLEARQSRAVFSFVR